MNGSFLKIGIISMLAIAVLWVGYVFFAGMTARDPDSFSNYARGEMSVFVTIPEAPPQPDLVFTGNDGEEVRLSDYRGKVILVNLWATWCGPCVHEMPALDALQRDLGGENFEVVTISLDRSFDDAREFYEERDLQHLPLIHDATFASPGRVGALGLPMSILYDRYGREIGRVPAPAEWHSEDAIRLIEAAIRLT